jgi:hypothetical protein
MSLPLLLSETAESGNPSAGDGERVKGHGATSSMGPMVRRRMGDVKKKGGCSVIGVRLSGTDKDLMAK